MLRFFKSANFPKTYEINCKFVEYIKQKFPSKLIISICEEENNKCPLNTGSSFARIFAAIKDLDSSHVNIIYTLKNGRSIFLRLIKEIDLLKILTIEPTGASHSSQWLHIILEKLFTASEKAHLPIIVYLNSAELNTGSESHFLSQYLAEYYLQNDSNLILPYKPWEINSCILLESLPKEIIVQNSLIHDFGELMSQKTKSIKITLDTYQQQTIKELIETIELEKKFSTIPQHSNTSL